MISPIPGWRWGIEEDEYSLSSPTGDVITYRERVRPLASATVVARRIMGQDPTVTWEPPGAITRLTTHEGEHAALLVVRGTRGTTPIGIVIGVVFGDDFYALVQGRSSDLEQMVELVRSLVLADSHALGLRRRRYEITPPTGWGGFALMFHAIYLHPRFPHDRTTITVYPALPRPMGIVDAPITLAAIHTLPHLPFDLNQQLGATPIQSKHGLIGQQFELASSLVETGGARKFVVLEDKRYLYAIALDTTGGDPEVGRVFAAMVDSIVPIPPPNAVTAAPDIAAVWTE